MPGTHKNRKWYKVDVAAGVAVELTKDQEPKDDDRKKPEFVRAYSDAQAVNKAKGRVTATPATAT